MSLSGYEVISTTVTSDVNANLFSGSVDLPSGKVVLGGGATIGDSNGRLLGSAPFLQNGDPIAWTATGWNLNPSAGQISMTVFLVCADA